MSVAGDDAVAGERPAAQLAPSSSAGSSSSGGGGSADDDHDGGAGDAVDAGKLQRMTDAVRVLLREVGEDVDREGLVKTPERYARALLFLTQGYKQTLRQVVKGAVFTEGFSEMVIVRDIDIYSVCEHHIVPFIGKCTIGYLPRGKVLGLSKLARIADMFCRRLQLQERLTRQIAEAVWESVEPLGVGVLIEAQHMCMVMRGVEKASATTVTSALLGVFQEDPRTRQEFLSLAACTTRRGW